MTRAAGAKRGTVGELVGAVVAEDVEERVVSESKVGNLVKDVGLDLAQTDRARTSRTGSIEARPRSIACVCARPSRSRARSTSSQ